MRSSFDLIRVLSLSVSLLEREFSSLASVSSLSLTIISSSMFLIDSFKADIEPELEEIEVYLLLVSLRSKLILF